MARATIEKVDGSTFTGQEIIDAVKYVVGKYYVERNSYDDGMAVLIGQHVTNVAWNDFCVLGDFNPHGLKGSDTYHVVSVETCNWGKCPVEAFHADWRIKALVSFHTSLKEALLQSQ